MADSNEREDLLRGNFLRRQWGVWTRTKIVSVALVVAIVLATAVTVTVVMTRPHNSDLAPTTPTPVAPGSSTTTTTPGTTIITTATSTTAIPTTTTEGPTRTTEEPTTTTTTEEPTTTTTTTEEPTTTTTTEEPTTTTTTEEPTTTTTTEEPTTTTTTEEPSTTTEGPILQMGSPTDEPFHPTTLKPLPVDAVKKPPINLLIEMGMRPVFKQIPCIQHDPQTFKFVVEILGTRNYTGVAGRKEWAKTASAIAASEAIFNLSYPKQIPSPKFPCGDKEF